ncbi:hypothetical protein [uncultured Tateyamaria sp.]|uniref:hypothetical protein n=1 Tax=uncultured Tateyamaria sp. TaxID=455651 RepID=UPI002638A6F4|nr:hypothetical protein [uncultured Tateyamaria sp.]
MSTIHGQALFQVGVYLAKDKKYEREFPVRDPVELSPADLREALKGLESKQRRVRAEQKIDENDKKNSQRRSRNRQIANKILETDLSLQEAYDRKN